MTADPIVNAGSIPQRDSRPVACVELGSSGRRDPPATPATYRAARLTNQGSRGPLVAAPCCDTQAFPQANSGLFLGGFTSRSLQQSHGIRFVVDLPPCPPGPGWCRKAGLGRHYGRARSDGFSTFRRAPRNLAALSSALYCDVMADECISPLSKDFSDSVKRKARELAFFKCCYCHDRQGHEVHHLTPKEEGGQGTLDNAILLCVQCHSDYGHRSDKRQQLRQARDHWYEIAAKRYSSPALEQIALLQDLATKNDIASLRDQMTGMFDTLMSRWRHGTTSTEEVLSVGSSMVNSLTSSPALGSLDLIGHSPTALTATHCRRCGSEERANAAFCSMCGQPLR